MTTKKVVYCEMEFLQAFLRSHPVLEANDESLKLIDAWMSFYQFFCKADIILNISASEFKSLVNTNQWLFRLWKKSTENLCGLEFEKDNFPDISSIQGSNASQKELNAVFLTTKDTQECEEISRKFGVFVFNSEMAKSCNHLFCDNGTAFPDINAKDWNFIKGLTGPNTRPPINISNSMLIIDNYLLSDDIDLDYQKKLEYNLKPILQNLLPEKLAVGETYEISVFVGAKKEVPKLYDEHFNYLIKLIQQLRKDLVFCLNIFSIPQDKYQEKDSVTGEQNKFHDRSIVTNNVLINSGHGFGILRKGGKTNTPTSVSIVFPFFQTKIAWCDNSYINIMKTAHRIVSSYQNQNATYWGDDNKNNRLISFYCPPKTINTQSAVHFSVPDENNHRNGRVIGKIDLSHFKDYKRANRKF